MASWSSVRAGLVVCLLGLLGARAWAAGAPPPPRPGLVLGLFQGATKVDTVQAGTVATLVATISSGPTVPIGQVLFCDATAPSCTDIHRLGLAQVTSTNTATMSFVPGVGTHSYVAMYLGTASYATATSNAVVLTVTPKAGAATPSVLLSTSGAAGNYTLTSSVSGTSLGPTGQVQLRDLTNGGYVLGSAGLKQSASQVGLLADGSFLLTPLLVLTGDFNGDGWPDVAVLGNGTGQVQVLLNNAGNGTFTTGPVTLVGASGPDAFAIGDFNSDGKLDLAVLDSSPSSLTILLGSGDGTFVKSTSFAVNFAPTSVAVADYNEDGIADLAVTSTLSPGVATFLGNGDGTFTTGVTTQGVAGNAIFVATGDLNGDGHADLAVASNNNTVTVLLGKGDGTFSLKSTVAAESAPSRVVGADVNGDGMLDLLVTNAGANTVSVLLGQGDGTFAAGTSVVLGQGPVALSVGDFNGDGVLDFVTSNFRDYEPNKSLTIALGNGDGTFVTGTTGPIIANADDVAAGDFNGDGLTDVVSESTTDKTVLVYTSQVTGTSTAVVTGISPVGTGTHLVDAAYAGDAKYLAGVSNQVPLTAQRVLPAEALSAVPANSSTVGQSVRLTVVVTAAAGVDAQGHVPGGSVQFSVAGGAALGSAMIVGGVATLDTTALPVGSFSVVAQYAGDENFDLVLELMPYTVVSAAKVAQTITFAPPGAAYVSTAALLGATASSGLPVTYKVVSGPGALNALNASVVRYTGAGTVVIEADQPGDATYAAAAPAQVSVPVTVLTSAVGTAVTFSTAVVVTTAGLASDLTALTQGAKGKDFVFGNSLGCRIATSYTAGAACVVSVQFKPLLPGVRMGAAVLDAGACCGVLGQQLLYGVGTGPMAGFVPSAAKTVLGDVAVGGIVFDGAGNLFYTDLRPNQTVVELTAASGYTNAVTVASGFQHPLGIAMDGAGNLFVADSFSNLVEELTALSGYTQVVAIGSGFNTPSDVAVDANGNVFVADLGSSALKEITVASGYTQVVTLPLAIPYFSPTGVALDANGNLFVTNLYGGQVLELTAASDYGVVVTIGSGWAQPVTVRVDAAGNLYVSDQDRRTLTKVAAASGYTTQQILVAHSNEVEAVGLDGRGDVFYAAYGQSLLQELGYADVPSLTFATTLVGKTSTDSPQSVTLINNGNAPLPFAGLVNQNNPYISAGFSFTSTCTIIAPTHPLTFALSAGDTCGYSVSYTPVTAGGNSGALTIVNNSLNVFDATQAIPLNGIATVPATTKAVLTTNTSPVFANTQVTLTATVSVVGTPSGASLTGTMVFTDNGVAIGAPEAVSSSGAAALVSPGFAAGDVLGCTYSGDANDAAATCNTITVMPKRVTTAVLTTNPSPVMPGTATTLMARLSGVGVVSGLPPTGVVQFTDNGLLLATVTVVNSAANLVSATGFAAGDVLGCSYSGDTVYAAALCDTITVMKPADFSLSAGPSITIQTEHNGTTELMLTSTGFAGNVTMSCVGPLPAYVTCEFPAGGTGNLPLNGSVKVPLKLDTDAVLNFWGPGNGDAPGSGYSWSLMLLPLLALRKRRWGRAMLLVVMGVGVSCGLSGCGSKWPGHTLPGVYTIPVKASGMSGAAVVSHTVNLTLTVTP